MPIYTYQCPSCGNFESHQPMMKVKAKLKCPECGKTSERNLLADASTVIGVGDASPKTLGALAERNANRMSADEKAALTKKHNAYREEGPTKELPTGMSRIEKPKD